MLESSIFGGGNECNESVGGGGFDVWKFGIPDG